jgi:hypothetical protein
MGDIIAEAWLEPIINPVTGKAHRAIIEIPEDLERTLILKGGIYCYIIL